MINPFNFIKKHGLIFTAKRLKSHLEAYGFFYTLAKVFGRKQTSATNSCKIDYLSFYNYILETPHFSFNQNDYLNNRGSIILNWIIPELGAASGGHINIFRFIEMLAKKGILNRVYIYDMVSPRREEDLVGFIEKHYGIKPSPNIKFDTNINQMKYAHGVFATSWQTAYYAKNFDNCLKKFYFVQDFEPSFFPQGSVYSFAENTYKFGFYGITAGTWLEQKLQNEYGMDTKGYQFSYDKDLYYKIEKRDNVKRVFFYFRPYTERRAAELGIMALSCLKQLLPDLEIWFAGWDVSGYNIPFSYKDLGILKLEQLCEVYSQCDMCLILSATNLSLLPLEVMASNSVVVTNSGKNTEWLLNETNSVIADLDPRILAEKMYYYLSHEDELAEIRNNGLKFVAETSWEYAGEIAYKTITNQIKLAEELHH